jgi:hypothetical protein
VVGSLINTAAAANNGLIGGAVINTGTFTNAPGAVVSGGLSNAAGRTVNAAGTTGGAISNLGIFNVTGALTGNSTFSNAGAGTLNVTDGNFSGITTLSNTSGAAAGVTVAAGRTLSANAITNAVGSTIVNNGTITSLLSPVVNQGTFNTTGVVGGGLVNTGRTDARGALSGAVSNSGIFNVTGALVADSVFSNSGAGTLNVTDGNFTGITAFTNAANPGVTIAATRTLSANSITNAAGGALSNNGTLTALFGPVVNAGVLGSVGVINGGLTNTGAVTASGTINGAIANTAGTFTVIGNLVGSAGFTNAGTGVLSVSGGNLTVASLANTSTAAPGVSIGAARSLAAATISNAVGASLSNAGTLTATGASIANSGIFVSTGAVAGGLNNAGSATMSGTLSGMVGNTGTFTVPANLLGNNAFANTGGGTLAVTGGTFSGIGALTNTSGAATGITVASGSTLSAASISNSAGSTIRNAGVLSSTAAIVNNGVLTSTGTVLGGVTNANTVNASGAFNGPIASSGLFAVTGPLTGNNVFTNVAGGRLQVGSNSFTGLTALNNAGSVTLGNGGVLGASALGNTGVFSVSGVATAQTGTFTNAAGGTVAMQNSATTDTLRITGNYVGAAGSQITADVDLSRTDSGQRGDRVTVSGTTSGTTAITLNTINFANRTFFTQPIVLMSAAGGNNANFVVDPASVARRGLVNYVVEKVGNDFQIRSTFDTAAAVSVVTNISGVINALSTGFHQPFSAIVSRPEDPVANQVCGGPFIRGNVGQLGQHVGGTGTDPAGVRVSEATRSKTDFAGLQGGADIGVCNIAGAKWNVNVGAMVGYVDASAESTRGTSPTSAKMEVPFGGLYAVVSNEGFTSEVAVRRDRYDAKITNSDAGLLNQKLTGNGLNVSGSMSYRFNVLEQSYIEPTIGLSWTETKLRDLPLAFGALQFGKEYSLLGRIGVTAGTVLQASDKLILQPFASAAVWHEFRERSNTNFAVPGFDVPVQTDRVGTFGQLGVGLAAKVLETGWAGFVRGDVRFGARLNGLGVNGGVRYQF